MAACKGKIKQLNQKALYLMSPGNVSITPGQLVQPHPALPNQRVLPELGAGAALSARTALKACVGEGASLTPLQRGELWHKCGTQFPALRRATGLKVIGTNGALVA